MNEISSYNHLNGSAPTQRLMLYFEESKENFLIYYAWTVSPRNIKNLGIIIVLMGIFFSSKRVTFLPKRKMRFSPSSITTLKGCLKFF